MRIREEWRQNSVWLERLIRIHSHNGGGWNNINLIIFFYIDGDRKGRWQENVIRRDSQNCEYAFFIKDLLENDRKKMLDETENKLKIWSIKFGRKLRK